MSSSINSGFHGFNTFTPVLPVLPTAPYTSAPSGSTEESKSGKSKTQVGILDEEMIKWLYKEGLSSDVTYFMEEMSNIISSVYNPVTGGVSLSAYKLLLPKLAEIKLEKELFDEAMKKARENDGLEEYALDARGYVYYVNYDTLSIDTKSIDEIQKGDVLLTNGDLAKMRAKDSRMAFNMDISNTIASGISMKKVSDYLKDLISGLGKDKTTGDSYIDRNGNVVPGAAELLRMLGEYLGTEKVTITSETQNKLANLALEYISHGLPRNMLNLLLLKAKEGNTTIENIIKSLVFSKVSTTNETKTSIELLKDKDGNPVLIPTSPAILFYQGRTPVKDFAINLGNGTEYAGKARIGHLLDSEGKNIILGESLAKAISGPYGGMLDKYNLTFGGARIVDQSLVRLLGDEMASVELPYERTEQGFIRPNIEKLQIVNEIMKIARYKGVQNNPKEVNKLFIEKNLDPLYKDNGEIDTNKYMRFMAIPAYVDKQALLSLPADDELMAVRNVEDDAELATVKRIFSLYMDKKAGYRFDSDNIMLGIVYVPINTSYADEETPDVDNGIFGVYQTSNLGLNLNLVDVLTKSQSLRDAMKNLGYKPAPNFTLMSK